MLEIKLRKAADGECPMCAGTGVMIPKDGEKRLVEVGRFCSECDEGRRRWHEVAKVMSVVDRELSYGGLGTGHTGADR